MRILTLTALAGVLAACGPDTDEAAEMQSAAAPDAAMEGAVSEAPASSDAPAPADTVVKDDAALHAVLVANADDLVPSVWSTGEPAPESALSYWIVPEIDVEAERSAACTPLAEPERAFDCTLTFVSIPQEGADEGAVTVRYRFHVEETGEGAFTLLSPDVRWAVQG